MTKTNLLPDEIEVYHDKFGDLLAFKEFDLRVPGTRYVRADLVSTPTKPAESDLDALKLKLHAELTDVTAVDIRKVVDFLYSSGHLATGKGAANGSGNQ